MCFLMNGKKTENMKGRFIWFEKENKPRLLLNHLEESRWSTVESLWQCSRQLMAIAIDLSSWSILSSSQNMSAEDHILSA